MNIFNLVKGSLFVFIVLYIGVLNYRISGYEKEEAIQKTRYDMLESIAKQKEQENRKIDDKHKAYILKLKNTTLPDSCSARLDWLISQFN